jgi:hypothetical protein
MDGIKLAGGSESDRQAVLDLQEAYLDANATFDWRRLEASIFSSDAVARFFNMNGHTYKGRDHWVELWKYYGGQLQTGAWIPFDVGGTVGADVAVLWCERKTAMRWTGSDQRPDDKWHIDQDFISRSTMVFQKDSVGWRVVHVHFSEANPGKRPGGI